MTPSDKNTRVRTGAWIISLGKLLASRHGDVLARIDLESIRLASSGASFFSAIRTLGSVTARRAEGFRISHGLSRPELESVLVTLQTLGYLQSVPGAKDDDVKIVLPNWSREDAYEVAYALFETFEPTDCAAVGIGIMDATAHLPQKRAELIEGLSRMFSLSEDTIVRALKHLEVLGAIQLTYETLDAEVLVYNPLHFEFRDEDAVRALNALDSEQKATALAVIEFIKTSPGVPVPLNMRGPVYDVLKKVGIIDVSIFSPRRDVQPHEFPTLPAAWGTVISKRPSEGAGADLVDDAKALLTSLRFGEHFATMSGGRIQDPFILLRALMRRGTVGPASNIGTDHILIVRRGIVDIIENPGLPGRFSMELRKPEVAEPVLSMLGGETDAPAEPSIDEGIDIASEYEPPETARSRVLRDELADLRDSVIFEALRQVRK